MFLSVSRNVWSINKKLVIDSEAIVRDGGILYRGKMIHYRDRKGLCTVGRSSFGLFLSNVFVL
jgi:hypothetical protein